MQAVPSRLDLGDAGNRTLSATGVIDAHTTDLLSAALGELGTEADVVLHLAGVTFIDSSGLRTIVSSHQTLEGAGHRLVLSEPSEAVDRLFDIAGLRDHLHIA